MNYIELFAGCGGLSLGLRAAGGKMLLANELSPMAAETYAYNLLGENLRAIADKKAPMPATLRTKWLRSRHGLGQLSQRLRENPQEYASLASPVCDLDSDALGLEGSLVVGNVTQLNAWLRDARNHVALEEVRNGFGSGGVDLVSGGPPCQSFSMAGMREYTNSRNTLPMEFAKFVELIRPKIAMLENVTGILRPFTIDGKEIFAWVEVAKAFARVGAEPLENLKTVQNGYVPVCLHVNAKSVGVAQNRPRFIMLLFRKDVFDRLVNVLHGKNRELLLSSGHFYSLAREGHPVGKEILRVYDTEKDLSFFTGTFLSPLSSCEPVSVKDAIGDLLSTTSPQSSYVQKLDRCLGPAIDSSSGTITGHYPVPNHVLREHRLDVQRRFRLYQVLSQVPQQVASAALGILNRKTTTLDDEAWKVLSQHAFYMTEGAPFYQFKYKSRLERFLAGITTGKHSQQALRPDAPAPAALSIPDDMCHYHEEIDGLRTLTVREMARIQSFPDKFVFCSKATTGGAKRKYEVPQYTQVGNAVPPLLGLALGEIVKELLCLYESGAPSKTPDWLQKAA